MSTKPIFVNKPIKFDPRQAKTVKFKKVNDRNALAVIYTPDKKGYVVRWRRRGCDSDVFIKNYFVAEKFFKDRMVSIVENPNV